MTSQLWRDGAVMLGKLNNDEFAMGSSNETSCFGPVVNPWRREGSNTTLVPGGSSGGSASAVAAMLCMGATATDTGGSIRQPAAFTGTVGIKPTYGRCSRWGIVAFASSLDQAGPIARTMRDTAILMRSMAGHDPKDTTSVDRAVPDYEAAIGKSVKGMKIGIPKEYRLDGMPAEIEKLWTEGAAWLKAAGAELVDMSLPHTKYALPAYYIVAPAEASSNLARYDGVRYGLRVPGRSIGELYENTRAEGFGGEVRRRVMIGTYVLSAGYYDAYYLRAQKVRTLIKKDFEDCFARGVDAILTPATPSAAFGVGEKGGADPIEMYLNDIFTVTVNMAGLPGIAVPAGKDAQGLPLGLQLIGRPFDEETLFSLGEVVEQAAGRFTPERWWYDGDFRASLSDAAPAPGLEPPLAALWWAAKGKWDEAHKIVQDESTLTPPGSMPICTGSKAISAMPATGTGRRASRSRRILWKPNGSGSCPRCSGVEKHERGSQTGKTDQGRNRRLGSRDRARSPRPGHLEIKAVLGRLDRIRRRAEHPCLAGRRGDAGHAARHQRGMRAAGGADRARAERARSICARCSTARTISIRIARRATRSASTSRRSWARARSWSNSTAATPPPSGSSGCIWNRTPASCCTISHRPCPMSTSTVAAWR